MSKAAPALRLGFSRQYLRTTSLVQRLDQLKHEQNDLHHEIHLAILRCSLKECRKFALEVHTQLPPELRDMVYQHAW